MKKILLLLIAFTSLGLFVPTDLSFAGTKTKKHVVQKKAKVKHKKLKVQHKPPRYAKNINQPAEGHLLKLEGMIKGINEQ